MLGLVMIRMIGVLGITAVAACAAPPAVKTPVESVSDGPISRAEDEKQPEVVDLIIDRPSAGRFGINVKTIDQAVYDAFGPRIICSIFAPTGEIRIVLVVAPTTVEDIRNVLEASSIPSALSSTGEVSLSTVVHTSSHSRPRRGFIDGNAQPLIPC